MKKIIMLAAVLFSAKVMLAQPPAGPVNVGNTYGAVVKPEGAIPVADLTEQLKKAESVETKVKAKVVDVCSKKGCWMALQMPDSSKVFVKMKDYGFFVPLEMIGRTVVLDGEAFVKTTSVAELRHYAEDAKKSKEEVAAITKPEKEIRFTAKGIVVVE